MDSIPTERVDGLPEVAVAELPDDAVILDVRDAADHRAGHAPGAVSMPLAHLGALSPDQLAEVLPVGADGRLVVSCGGGSKQTRAAAYLRAHGIDAVVLQGGMRGWRSAGRRMVTDAPDDPA